MKRAAALALAASLLAGCASRPESPPASRTAAAATAEPTAASLGWLAGRWVMTTPDGEVEEAWLPPAAGTLYGVGRTISGGTTRFFEFLAVEPRDGASAPTLAYVARPRGAAPTEFLLVEIAPGRVVFANPAHDFPKRISYESRGADRLHARVDDGTDDGEGEDFDYVRGD